jgi:peptide chain release factor 2
VARPIFDESKLREKVGELEQKMSAPNFWNEREQAQKVSRELAEAKKTIATWENLATEHADLLELIELTDESDRQAVTELTAAIEQFAKKLNTAELTLYLGGEFDDHDALISIHAGAGGTDAADWAAMVLRMYLRYAEQKGWQTQILEKSESEEAGIKSATIEIKGAHAYGFLKGEKGAHRLVRRSPFNSAASRETSFTQVEILPVIEDDAEIEIRPDELKVDTFCAGGAGGQHVNRTESAVRITHLPTGLVAFCQNERSQHQNREQALTLLRGKLAEKKVSETEARARELRGEAAKADFGGDAIRSYILDDRRVKDRRTGYETFDPEGVLDGDLEPFIRSYLTAKI